jgi:hypothetical protein
MQNKISVANIIMLVGAVVTFIFSFLDFFEGFNAWDNDVLAFATTVPAILALVMGVWIALELAGVSLPADVLTFSPAQLKATWGITAAGIMLSWLTVDSGDKGAGFWLMFLGSLAMAVGAVMALLGKGTDMVDIPGGGRSTTGTTTSTTSTATTGATAPPPPPPAADAPGTTTDV